MYKIGLVGILLIMFCLFLINILSSINGIQDVPNPLFQNTRSHIFSMAIFSVGLIIIDIFLRKKKK